jgi:hypothetical protein
MKGFANLRVAYNIFAMSSALLFMNFRRLVPHSQCSLKENPNILQNLRSKNNTFGFNF